MYELANLDDRERVIFDTADQWWATRFQGRGVYDRIGPFSSQREAIGAVIAFFRIEERDYPPPGTLFHRPFALYASSSTMAGAHIIVGNVYRDGVKRPTHKEVSQKLQEERKRVAKQRPRNRSNSERAS